MVNVKIYIKRREKIRRNVVVPRRILLLNPRCTGGNNRPPTIDITV